MNYYKGKKVSLLPSWFKFSGWFSFKVLWFEERIWIRSDIWNHYLLGTILVIEAIGVLEHELIHLEQVKRLGSRVKFLKEALFWRWNINLFQNYLDSWIEKEAIEHSDKVKKGLYAKDVLHSSGVL